MALSWDLKELLSLFARHEVEFMLVGAHALAYHGFPRNTEDIDFWLRRTEENAHRVLAALDEFGFGGLGLGLADLIDERMVIQLGKEPHRIDLLTFLTGLDFEDCRSRKIPAKYEGIPLDVIALEDLLKNKRATGREKDLADVAEFERSSMYGIEQDAEDR